MSKINKSLCIGLLLFFICFQGCAKEIQVSESKLNSIKVGDSKDTVESILGKPLRVGKYEFRGRAEESWTYSNSQTASTNQQVIFDVETGVVIEVIHME